MRRKSCDVVGWGDRQKTDLKMLIRGRRHTPCIRIAVTAAISIETVASSYRITVRDGVKIP